MEPWCHLWTASSTLSMLNCSKTMCILCVARYQALVYVMYSRLRSIPLTLHRPFVWECFCLPNAQAWIRVVAAWWLLWSPWGHVLPDNDVHMHVLVRGARFRVCPLMCWCVVSGAFYEWGPSSVGDERVFLTWTWTTERFDLSAPSSDPPHPPFNPFNPSPPWSRTRSHPSQRPRQTTGVRKITVLKIIT